MVSNNLNAVGRSRRGNGRVEAARANGCGVAGAEESTEDLLRRYRRRGCTQLRDRVVERHRGVVEAMAQGLAARLPRSVDPQDLVHAGIWGLMQAIANYAPARCDRFTAFMRIRVRGAMLDELRHMDFLPRLFRRRLRERDAAVGRLRSALGREPRDIELAAELGISEAQLWRRYQSLVRPAVHSGDGEHMENLADDGVESPIDVITRQELLSLIRRSLRPVEWKVLQLHYLEGKTGKQIARSLRLSASRICQIHGRVLDRLKTQFAAAAAV